MNAIKTEKNCALQEKDALLLSTEGREHDRVGLGREEQIPALKSHFRSEKSNPFTLQESGVGKSTGHTSHHSATSLHNKVLLLDFFLSLSPVS